MQDARGKNMEGQKKIRGKLFYRTKKIVTRENRKRKKPSDTDSKFKIQEKKMERRNKGRSNHMEHCANATSTSVKYCYHSSYAAILQKHPAGTDPKYLQEEGRITTTYLQMRKLSNPLT